MKLYVKTGCPWCIDAVDWLNARNLDFEEIDVFESPSAFTHMREISGQSKAPTLELPDGEVLADFDVRQLERFLDDHGAIPAK